MENIYFIDKQTIISFVPFIENTKILGKLSLSCKKYVSVFYKRKYLILSELMTKGQFNVLYTHTDIKEVEYLDFSKNESIQDIAYFNRLTKLCMNPCSHIASISTLTRLKSLTVSVMTENINYLTNLEDLTIHGEYNNLTQLHNTKLTSVCLYGKTTVNFDELTNLQKLEINDPLATYQFMFTSTKLTNLCVCYDSTFYDKTDSFRHHQRNRNQAIGRQNVNILHSSILTQLTNFRSLTLKRYIENTTCDLIHLQKLTLHDISDSITIGKLYNLTFLSLINIDNVKFENDLTNLCNLEITHEKYQYVILDVLVSLTNLKLMKNVHVDSLKYFTNLNSLVLLNHKKYDISCLINLIEIQVSTNLYLIEGLDILPRLSNIYFSDERKNVIKLNPKFNYYV